MFKRQKVIQQYRVEKYFIDLYFLDHKLGIEIDENGHLDRLEQEREETINNSGITLIRINPDKEGFDISIKIGEIQDFIYKSGFKIGQESEKKKKKKKRRFGKKCQYNKNEWMNLKNKTTWSYLRQSYLGNFIIIFVLNLDLTFFTKTLINIIIKK